MAATTSHEDCSGQVENVGGYANRGTGPHLSRKAVICPVIDVINDRTFAYQRGIELFRGGFNWNLQFRWYGIPPFMLKDRPGASTTPIK